MGRSARIACASEVYATKAALPRWPGGLRIREVRSKITDFTCPGRCASTESPLSPPSRALLGLRWEVGWEVAGDRNSPIPNHICPTPILSGRPGKEGVKTRCYAKRNTGIRTFQSRKLPDAAACCGLPNKECPDSWPYLWALSSCDDPAALGRHTSSGRATAATGGPEPRSKSLLLSRRRVVMSDRTASKLVDRLRNAASEALTRIYPHLTKVAWLRRTSPAAKMEGLPSEVQRAICKDAQLARIWRQQQEEIQWWVAPIFHLWMKIAHYERQWPGSTEVAEPCTPSVVWF